MWKPKSAKNSCGGNVFSRLKKLFFSIGFLFLTSLKSLSTTQIYAFFTLKNIQATENSSRTIFFSFAHDLLTTKLIYAYEEKCSELFPIFYVNFFTPYIWVWPASYICFPMFWNVRNSNPWRELKYSFKIKKFITLQFFMSYQKL